jgi:peptidoglycan biosynthesis protein MviN/MurJ (putative lipid II flippase)
LYCYTSKLKMIIFRLLPVILSFLLVAAHFSRADQTIPAIVALIFPLLLLIRKRIIIRLFQVVLILAGAEWIRAMLGYIEVRKTLGDDYIRLAVILSVVAIYTAASGLFLQNKKILDIYKS